MDSTPLRKSSPPATRQAEVIAALSLATDLGMGQPLGHALSRCLVAMRLGSLWGLDAEEMRRVYDVALLRRIGCTADAHELSLWFYNELSAHARSVLINFNHPWEVLGDLLRHAGAGESPLERARTLGSALRGGREGIDSLFRTSCEVAQKLGDGLGIHPGVQRALGQTFERWDGGGLPDGLKGDAIMPAVRIAHVAEGVEVAYRLGKEDAVQGLLTKHSGTLYDPRVVDLCLRNMPSVVECLAQPSPWDAVLSAEPLPHVHSSAPQVDAVLRVMAEFADIKSPYFAGHSLRVSELAAEAARLSPLPEADVEEVRRAGLVHDLGRVAVPNGAWEKPGPLTDEEREQMMLHPYYTERILARVVSLEHVGSLASYHHERLDSSGYHRRVGTPSLSMPARILAVADAYETKREHRPHRPAASSEEALAFLRSEAKAWRLDGHAVDAIAAAVAGRPRRQRRGTALLSDREVEVLRLAVRGLPNRKIAADLFISPHTVGNHIRHIYEKLGVSTRAAATLVATRQGLLDPGP